MKANSPGYPGLDAGPLRLPGLDASGFQGPPRHYFLGAANHSSPILGAPDHSWICVAAVLLGIPQALQGLGAIAGSLIEII